MRHYFHFILFIYFFTGREVLFRAKLGSFSSSYFSEQYEPVLCSRSPCIFVLAFALASFSSSSYFLNLSSCSNDSQTELEKRFPKGVLSVYTRGLHSSLNYFFRVKEMNGNEEK